MLHASGPISKVGGCLAEEGEEINMKGGLQVLQVATPPCTCIRQCVYEHYLSRLHVRSILFHILGLHLHAGNEMH